VLLDEWDGFVQHFSAAKIFMKLCEPTLLISADGG
jgi:hypothetical protein